jgi:hypothetical protein
MGKRGPAKGTPKSAAGGPQAVRHTPGDIFCDACQKYHTMSSFCWIPPVLAAVKHEPPWWPWQPLPDRVKQWLGIDEDQKS